ncbi:MAG: hypothetical protein GY708_09840 [Actinomycetia bacterium]|nr:hypothetical protein [Actinomycetes bacterium]
MIGRIIGLLSIPAVGLALWGLWRQVSAPRPLSRWTPIIGLVMAPLTLVVNLLVLRQARPEMFGVALGVFGLGFGIAWGQAARFEVVGTQVLARRSVMHLACWAVSYAMTQLLASFATAGWVAGGLTAMFFAAGSTIGTNVDLLVRRRHKLAQLA